MSEAVRRMRRRGGSSVAVKQGLHRSWRCARSGVRVHVMYGGVRVHLVSASRVCGLSGACFAVDPLTAGRFLWGPSVRCVGCDKRECEDR